MSTARRWTWRDRERERRRDGERRDFIGGRVRLAFVELKMILVLISNLLDGKGKIV